jgi:hypothetical protein
MMKNQINSICEIIIQINNLQPELMLKASHFPENINTGGIEKYRLRYDQKIGESGFIFFGLDIVLHTKKLWNAYESLPDPKLYQGDFTQDEAILCTLLERRTKSVLENLKSYNGVADNYVEIAKLIDGTRGSALGKKFGF